MTQVTETFESYTNGQNLSGASGGSGWSTSWAVAGGSATASNAVPQAGSLEATLTGAGSFSFSRTYPTISGTTCNFTAWMRRPSGSTSSKYYAVRSGGSDIFLFGIEQSSGKVLVYYAPGYSVFTFATPIVDDTWYGVDINFDTTAHTFTVAPASGSSGNTSGTLSFITNAAPDTLFIYEGGGTSQTVLVDTISISDTPVVTTQNNAPFFMQMLSM